MRDAGHRAVRQAKAFKASESGVSAVEFALIAPVLAFAAVAMADIGVALHERMDIDHVLRAGAQAAMADPAPAEVDGVMQAALAGLPFAGEVVLEPAVRYCACPENADAPPEEAVACTSLACAGSAAPYVFYRMEATKAYSPMSLPETLPDFTLSSLIEVQVR